MINKLYVSTGLILLSLKLVLTLKENLLFSGDQSLNLLQNHGRKLSFEDEYKLFEDELDKGIAKHNTGKSRHKRYVYLNTEANVDVGFLIVIPITVVLPGMTNLFNVWRRKRSLPGNLINVTSEEDPYVQSQVDRISSYFDLVHIPETSCQLRTICELAAEPAKYFPLSDVILSRLRQPGMGYHAGNRESESSPTTPTLFSLYNKAADEGNSFGTMECEKVYKKTCKYSTDKLLNMSIMKFWGKAQSQLKLKFDEDSELA